jgi:hypothetical protein
MRIETPLYMSRQTKRSKFKMDENFYVDFSTVQVKQDGSVELVSRISSLEALIKLVDLTENEWNQLNATSMSKGTPILGLLYRRIKS